MKILLTAFEPFNGEKINPAQLLMEAMPEELAGIRIEKAVLPTEFRKSLKLLETVVLATKPQVVLSLGQAGGRSAMTVERIGINLDDARIKDNGGRQPIDEAINPTGPAAYFATVPIKAMVAAMREAGVPAEVSNTAGTYVCNHVLYGLLDLLARELPASRGGFIHLPYLKEQVVDKPDMPAMDLEDMVKGLTAACLACGRYQEDLKVTEGKED